MSLYEKNIIRTAQRSGVGKATKGENFSSHSLAGRPEYYRNKIKLLFAIEIVLTYKRDNKF